jgi:ORF6N domain
MMSKEIILIGRIAQSILYLRGQKVLLDRDLAALYGVETRTLNQAVKRNRDRFPDDFAFTLSRGEIERISQTVTSSADLKFSKQVRAFTEQGVAMLSSVLNNERAVKVNVAIMRVGKHDNEIAAIIETIPQLMPPPERPRGEIGFHVREKTPRYRVRKRR